LRFVVIDSGGQKLAYVDYEEEPGRRSAAKSLTKDEAGLPLISPSCRSYQIEKVRLSSTEREATPLCTFCGADGLITLARRSARAAHSSQIWHSLA
jgi:hypothetical protein